MKVNIYGGGLAGCECAYQLLKRGISVDIIEMKRLKKTPAHNLDTLCELVCSNSLKSNDLATGSGLLKAELRMLDCLTLRCADEASVPAGNALAVDRTAFSELVTKKLNEFSNFNWIDKVAEDFLPNEGEISVVATGPLTDEAMIPAMEDIFGKDFLYFFDAVAPIITAESIDFSSAFVASRYNKGEADYVNCPMNKEQYLNFWQELTNAETVEVKDFENNIFESCMPVEVMAKRGVDTMRFGMLKPVGLVDDRTGERNYAVLQLRKENKDGTLYNLVGCQTHLKWSEQKRVFSLIPALSNAEFVRYGVMHRNTYINAPKFLNNTFQFDSNKNLYFAGQLTGVEGYMESVASGLVVGLSVFANINDLPMVDFADTMIGALCSHVSTDFGKYQPMNSNFGILPPLAEKVRDKSVKKQMYASRAINKIETVKNILGEQKWQ